jgi:hypothetical protein
MNVERVEIAHCAAHRWYGSVKICHDILKRLQRLPRIKPVVLLSDCLNGVAPRNASYLSVLSRTEFVPVRSHMQ